MTYSRIDSLWSFYSCEAPFRVAFEYWVSARCHVFCRSSGLCIGLYNGLDWSLFIGKPYNSAFSKGERV